MAITTEKLLKLSQFQTGLQAAKDYTDGEIAKANAEIATVKGNVSTNTDAIATLQDKVDTGDQTVSAYVESQGFLTDADIVIDVATDEEVTQICNTVFGTAAA